MKIARDFILLSLVFAYFLVLTPTAHYAQESVIETDTPVGREEEATESAPIGPQRVNYELPYPGMLPDNPLYVLKMVRDGIIKALINDDLTRAKFSLENAEKRIFAGKLLIDKGKDGLALETITKGVNYLDDAIVSIKKVKKSEETDYAPFLHRFRSSTQKLQEVVNDQKTATGNQYIKTLDEQEIRIAVIEKNVENLLRQK